MEGIRPTFLTVLCILTFLYSGFSIVNGARVYMNPYQTIQETQDQFDELEDQIDQDEMPAIISDLFSSVSRINTPETLKKNSMATIIVSILTLLGAIFMWDLKKRGFYIYVAGTIAGVIIPLVVYGGNFLGIASAFGAAVIGGLFVYLYSRNLQHMN